MKIIPERNVLIFNSFFSEVLKDIEIMHTDTFSIFYGKNGKIFFEVGSEINYLWYDCGLIFTKC